MKILFGCSFLSFFFFPQELIWVFLKLMKLCYLTCLGCLNLIGILLPKQDENRYNASRGAHLNLKRAEKARILVNKIPGIFRIRELTVTTNNFNLHFLSLKKKLLKSWDLCPVG